MTRSATIQLRRDEQKQKGKKLDDDDNTTVHVRACDGEMA